MITFYRNMKAPDYLLLLEFLNTQGIRLIALPVIKNNTLRLIITQLHARHDKTAIYFGI